MIPSKYTKRLRGAFVYRIFDRGGALLYIGSTTDLTRRFVLHQHSSAFFDAATTNDIRVTEYPTLSAAKRAEKLAIRSEHPRWNIQYRSANHPDGYAERIADIAEMFPGTYRSEVVARLIYSERASRTAWSRGPTITACTTAVTPRATTSAATHARAGLRLTPATPPSRLPVTTDRR